MWEFKNISCLSIPNVFSLINYTLYEPETLGLLEQKL